MNLTEAFILFFSLQATLLGIFFWCKAGDEQYGNRVLAILLLSFGIIIFYNVLFWSKMLFTPAFIHLNQTYLIPQSLLAPLFFFYIRKIVDRRRIRWSRDWWHFLPAIYLLVGLFPYFMLTAGQKMEIFQQRNLPEHTWLSFPPGLPLTLLMCIYFVYIYRAYSKKFSADQDLRMWLRAISLSFLGCILSYLAYYLLVYTGILKVQHDYAITVFMAVCVLIVSFFSFNQPEIFNGKPIQAVAPVFKYKNNGITGPRSERIKQRLLEFMETERPYLEGDLRLDELAEMLGEPRHHTSQVINEHFQQNFNDFINTYRIRAAIDMLQDKRIKYSLKDIGYQVGFNNYVSFYKAFKKITGMVPKEYRKIQQAAENNR